ncbi:S9 family peptidase [Actinomadura oligospora]|uniref:S9 family peptidase n=1 Tax=Actinomadura oligospora TaxID=111804 RepID=UPI0004B71EB2|nr:prolyl oligopeptidase family serine peptidase [Actinomadura oligospora]
MSDVPAELVARSTVAYDAVQAVDDAIFWIEGRPDGRDVLVRWTPEDGPLDVPTGGHSVASRVHEYGGGAYWATRQGVWFSSADDQRIYWASNNTTPIPITPPSGDHRYADMRPSVDGHGLWAVRERHDGNHVSNDLVLIDRDGSVRSMAYGADFYSAPRPSPDGRWLAWTSWNAPLMPWDGTQLWVAEIRDKHLGTPLLVAGGPEESVFQPEWSPAGVLHFVSDRSGWWNLYTWQQGHVQALLQDEREFGIAQWELGYSTYAFLTDGRIVAAIQQGSQHTLEVLTDGKPTPLDQPYTSIKPYLSASGTQIAFIGSSPTRAPEVALLDTNDSALQRINTPPSEATDVVLPHPFAFPTRDGGTAHGLYHPPRNGHRTPPLIVKAHPGPTANVPLRLDWHTQFLTSRGYAVAEIDYRGSTGYGRPYRQALKGNWGITDAHDCADAALHLSESGLADPQRLAIWGASAGGYTAIRALALTNVFAAAIARCPVVDPTTWRNVAPKFHAHHTDGLIGPWPETVHLYQERSLLTQPEQITRPVLILHGENDPITPVNQSRTLTQNLGQLGELITFPKEGHTLRSPEAVQTALQSELAFLRTHIP